ncbi:hypothetical protein BT63DRAFT_427616 [Microthyrium microscopicum]|uniref:Uncharacterized protein n=1 Tax=Microthyrium microscopicum TaxID=703497 RepID=A0A6A6U6K0_9PEZI|nr:hypothetical protein BT63DRAFT_427616 [Microthyrium microscopicum]
MPTSTTTTLVPRADTISLRSSVPSSRPPSYGRHLHDELVSRTSLSAPRNRNSHASHITAMLLLLTSPAPLTLTIDNNLLYPPPPSTALYHLPRLLTWSGNEISLARSMPAARRPGQIRDLALYTLRRTPFTHEVALLPRREGLKPATMRGRRGVFGGMRWDVEIRGEPLLRYRKGAWRLAKGGMVVATEKVQREAKRPGVLLEEDNDSAEEVVEREEITIAGEGIELWMKDLLVASWCAKVWMANAKSGMARTFIRGQRWKKSDFTYRFQIVR